MVLVQQLKVFRRGVDVVGTLFGNIPPESHANSEGFCF